MKYPRKLVMVTVAGVAAVSAVSAAGAGGFGYNHDSQQSSGVVKVTYDNPQGWTLAENGYSVFVPGGTLGDKSLQIKGQAGGTVVYLPSFGGPARQRLLSELTSFGYASQRTLADEPSARISVSGANTTDRTGNTVLVYEAARNGWAGASGWHRNDALHGLIYSLSPLRGGGCDQATPCPISEFLDINPHAQVTNMEFVATSGQGAQIDDVIVGFGVAADYDLGG
jgi:hypothetical protein